jgi:hypothetical protein
MAKKNDKIARKIKRLEILDRLMETLGDLEENKNSDLKYYTDRLKEELAKEEGSINDWTVEDCQRHIEEINITISEIEKLVTDLEKMS